MAVPLLTRLGPAEIPGILRHAGASIALCSEAGPEIRASVETVVTTSTGGTVHWRDLLAADDGDLGTTPEPDDVADVMYTSGTTGRPKGVVVPHASLATMDRVPSAWLGLGFLTSSPFATTSGSLLVTGPLPRRPVRMVPPALRSGSLDQRCRSRATRRCLPRPRDGGAHRRQRPLRHG